MSVPSTMVAAGVLALGLLAAVPAPAVASTSEALLIASNPIPSASAARPAPEPLEARLTLPTAPATASPGQAQRYPVIILLHGCGGISRNIGRWVDRVNEWGYAALVLNSFSARHVTTVCAPADQPKVTALDRAGDVMNAAVALAARPDIDGARIGVVGFSHGGGTAVTLTRGAFDLFHPGLIKASVNYYGPCREPHLHGRVPLLSLNGDADTWGDPARTCADFDARVTSGATLALHTYPGVMHGFDNPDIVGHHTNLGHPIEYNWGAARDSYERTHAFLDRFVKGTN